MSVQTQGAGLGGRQHLAQVLAAGAEQGHAPFVVVGHEDAALLVHAHAAGELQHLLALAAVDEDDVALLVHAREALPGAVRHQDVVAVHGQVAGHLEQLLPEVVLVDAPQASSGDVHNVDAGRVLAAAGQVDGGDGADAPVILAGLHRGLQGHLVADGDDVDDFETRHGDHGRLQPGASPRLGLELQALGDEAVAVAEDRLDAAVLVVHGHHVALARQQDVADVRGVLVALHLGGDLLQEDALHLGAAHLRSQQRDELHEVLDRHVVHLYHHLGPRRLNQVLVLGGHVLCRLEDVVSAGQDVEIGGMLHHILQKFRFGLHGFHQTLVAVLGLFKLGHFRHEMLIDVSLQFLFPFL